MVKKAAKLPAHEISGSPVGDGGAALAEIEVHDTSVLPVQQSPDHRDELVGSAAKAGKVEAAPTLTIEKTQGLVFVSAYYNHQYTEFVLEDATAITQAYNTVTVLLRDGHGLSFACTKMNADLLLDAWRSRRAAKRNT